MSLTSKMEKMAKTMAAAAKAAESVDPKVERREKNNFMGISTQNTILARKTKELMEVLDEKIKEGFIDPKELVIDWDRRRSLAPDDLAELRASIKKNGVIESVVTAINPDGKLELISGHNRTAICLEEQIDKIPFSVRKFEDDLQKDQIAFDSNANHFELSTYDIAAFIEKLRVKHYLNIPQIVDLTGMSRGYVSEISQMYQLPQKAINAFKYSGKKVGAKMITESARIWLTGQVDENTLTAAINEHLIDQKPWSDALASVDPAKKKKKEDKAPLKQETPRVFKLKAQGKPFGQIKVVGKKIEIQASDLIDQNTIDAVLKAFALAGGENVEVTEKESSK